MELPENSKQNYSTPNWNLMLMFCIPTVWRPHEDEEPALRTYGCPPSQDPSASAKLATNSPRGRLLLFLPRGNNLTLNIYCIYHQDWTGPSCKVWRTEQTQQHLLGTEWTWLSSAKVNLAGDRLIKFSFTEEKWTEFKLIWTDISWNTFPSKLPCPTQDSFQSPFP